MIKNNLKIAWRNLQKNQGTSLINIVGLSIGIAACLLIALYINHEITYDHQIPDAQKIYRLYGIYNLDGKIQKGAHFSANMARTLENDFGEVVQSGRLMENPLFYGAGSNLIRIEGDTKQNHEEGFTYADQAILDMFSLPMVYGDRSSALTKPRSIVISERIANKYFNGQNPVGQSIYLNGRDTVPFTIGGVMKDFPSNSHLDYDFLITLTDVEFGQGEQTRWMQSNYFTYMIIKDQTDIDLFKKRMSHAIITQYMVPALKAAGNVMAETIERQASLELQPIQTIHLHSSDIFDAKVRGDIKYVWLFGIVAIFILFIACINFINLSTAKSANRAKEVGLRKVLGSGKKNLMYQFLTESILMAIMAFGLGIILAYFLLPYFNQLAGQNLRLPLSDPWFIPAFFLTAGLIGIFAGIYPAFYLSAFNPIKVLKGKIRLGSKSTGLRSTLVVFQFTISAILIIGTVIINNQMNFILNKEIGFEKDQVIQLHGANMLGDQVETFKNELKELPSVVNASISDFLPIEGTKRNGNPFWNEGKVNIDERVAGQAWVIDEDYLNTLGIQLIAGRNFSQDRSSDRQSVIINKQMARQLGLEDPVGQKISRGGDQLYDVIGVVEDFHFQSFRQEVGPLAFFSGISPSIISLKVNTGDLSGLLSNLEDKWKQFTPNLDFRYTFMDQSFARMYDNVSRIRMIFTSFAILAIFIAGLGLFALSAFVVEQRSKEMSIRKVLGATTRDIFQLLTRNFLSLVLLSFVIATPIAAYLMQKWLQDYAYRIDITWQVFVLSGTALIIIAISTISFNAIKSSLTNPVNNLKSE